MSPPYFNIGTNMSIHVFIILYQVYVICVLLAFSYILKVFHMAAFYVVVAAIVFLR